MTLMDILGAAFPQLYIQNRNQTFLFLNLIFHLINTLNHKIILENNKCKKLMPIQIFKSLFIPFVFCLITESNYSEILKSYLEITFQIYQYQVIFIWISKKLQHQLILSFYWNIASTQFVTNLIYQAHYNFSIFQQDDITTHDSTILTYSSYNSCFTCQLMPILNSPIQLFAVIVKDNENGLCNLGIENIKSYFYEQSQVLKESLRYQNVQYFILQLIPKFINHYLNKVILEIIQQANNKNIGKKIFSLILKIDCKINLDQITQFEIKNNSKYARMLWLGNNMLIMI
ncbi:unnamed protein product [Paramecium sonneborni]|uniref:Uncharacterized protein n=1 Tax=Paramecium sonneborni TaxID=65129 RepID=A0A8S1RL88_9CILI|nr:unnamed protein product [Paramecium sonneborni]